MFVYCIMYDVYNVYYVMYIVLNVCILYNV